MLTGRDGVDTPQTVMTTRAPAVLKNQLANDHVKDISFSFCNMK